MEQPRILTLSNITKRFASQEVLTAFSLAIEDGEFFTILGPSGCGKTTVLRLIAGFEQPDEGTLLLNGVDITRMPAEQRPVNTVFQSYALFPHMSVFDNVAFGLKMAGVGRQETADRVNEALAMVRLSDYAMRKPHQLSGGQKQRVAMARAIVIEPDVLLMDEPLSALDEERKQEIMPWLESLHGELEIPVLYVSHSRDEVARLADHLVLLENGRVRADGPVGAMLTRLDLPLAHGDDAEALVEATVAGHDETYGLTWLDFRGGRFSVIHKELAPGARLRLRVLARDVSLTLEAQHGTSILNIFPATVDALIKEGEARVVVRLLAGGVPLLARVTRKSVDTLQLQPGKLVYAQAKSVAVLS